MMKADLDAHDALVRACIDGSLSFEDFLGAYGEFPANLQVERVAGGAETVMRLFRQRLLFHSQVGRVLSGLKLGDLQLAGADFGPRVGLMRLRSLVARYPTFESMHSDILQFPA
jgi:hypothetical protein